MFIKENDDRKVQGILDSIDGTDETAPVTDRWSLEACGGRGHENRQQESYENRICYELKFTGAVKGFRERVKRHHE